MKIAPRTYLLTTCLLMLSPLPRVAYARAKPAPKAAVPPKTQAAEPAVTDDDAPADSDVVVELPTSSGTTMQLGLNLYGNMGAALTSQAGAVDSAFSLGQAVVIVAAEVGAQVRALGELTFQAISGGGKLERMVLNWSDGKFFLAGGRMHTDIGYWNTAFHHGLWLQLPINRPSVLSFAGGLVPVHYVGLRGGFDQPIGDGSLRVLGAISNGRGDQQGDVRLAEDTNKFKALLLTVTYRGLGLPDLNANVGLTYDRIAVADATIRPSLPDETIEELIANAYVTYTGERLTVIAEAFLVNHSASAQSWQTWDAFALVGYKLGELVPYAMVEWQGVPDSLDPDPFYVPDTSVASQPFDFVQSTAGARLGFGGNNTVKLEYRWLHPLKQGDDDIHVVAIDWAFGI